MNARHNEVLVTDPRSIKVKDGKILALDRESGKDFLVEFGLPDAG